MNILSRININLTETDVKEIIAEYLTEKGYPSTPKDVTLNVGMETEGYGPMEHEVCRFREASVEVRGEIIYNE